MDAAFRRSRLPPDMRAGPGRAPAFFLVLATLALTLAACGPADRPFQPQTKELGGLQSPHLSDKFGVFVAGIDNAPPAADDALSNAVVSALGAAGIPASRATANRGSYMLIGRSAWQPTSEPSGRSAVDIEWRVIDAAGEAIAVMAHRAYAGGDQWANGDPAVMRSIAKDLALQLNDLLGGTASPGTEPSTPSSYPLVSVDEIDSAPGDGRTSLAAAMRRALNGRGVPVVETSNGGELSVRCTVETTRAGGRERVEIRWAVIDARGAELGSIEQDNTIAPGTLDGAWGPIADAIAAAAADGLLDLLARTDGHAPAGLQPPGALIQSAPVPPSQTGDHEGSQP